MILLDASHRLALRWLRERLNHRCSWEPIFNALSPINLPRTLCFPFSTPSRRQDLRIRLAAFSVDHADAPGSSETLHALNIKEVRVALSAWYNGSRYGLEHFSTITVKDGEPELGGLILCCWPGLAGMIV